jgi:hypothetical protein
VGDLEGVNRILGPCGDRYLKVGITYKLFICKVIAAFLRELLERGLQVEAGLLLVTDAGAYDAAKRALG